MTRFVRLGNGYTFNGLAYTREIYKPVPLYGRGSVWEDYKEYHEDKSRDTKVSDLVGEYIIQRNELFSIFLLENIWKITDYYYDDQTDVCCLRYLAKNIVTDEEKEISLGNYRIINFTERTKIHEYQYGQKMTIYNLTT